MPTPCVFCGRTDRPITREHIFAEWVDKLFPEAAATKSLSVLIKRDGTEKPYQAFPFEQTVRVVCDKCNNEWMSRLERAVAPVLGPMIRDGKWIRLTPRVQQTLATWAVKTAFMLQYLHPSERSVPDSEYHDFYVAQEPLPGHMVWLGHRTNLYDSTGAPLIFAARMQEISSIRREGVSEQDVHGMVDMGSRVYRVTFALGGVVLLVFGHTFPTVIKVGVPVDMMRAIRCIWPLQRRSSWPPSEKVPDVDALHNIFENLWKPTP
jgi:hypothetical protein